MKVAFVYDRIYPYSKGGVEKRVADLARELTGRGYEVERYGIQAWQGPSRLDTEHGFLVGIPNRSVTSFENSLTDRISYAARLVWKLWHSDADVVDAQSMAPLACLAAVVVCRIRKIPCVVTWHEVWLDTWTQRVGWIGFLGGLVERLIARLGQSHVAVSRHTAERLRRLGRMARVLPSGVTMPPQTASARERSGVVFVGRLVEHKNPRFVVEAARLALTKSDHIFRVIGDGPLLEELASASVDLPNLEVVGPVGSEDEVFELLDRARVFASPSVREGFGVAALEAMAAGVPVVTVDHPDNGTSELVTPFVSGLLTAADPIAFAQGLREVLENDALHEQLSKGASQVGEKYAWSTMVEGFEALYQELAATQDLSRNRRLAVLEPR